MSLYNHVASKDDVLALMADAVASEVACAEPDDEPLEAIRAFAVDARRTGAPPLGRALWLRQLPGPHVSQHMELLLAALRRNRLSPVAAHHGFHAVNNHVFGYTLQELAMAYAMTPEGDATLPAVRRRPLPEDHPHTIATCSNISTATPPAASSSCSTSSSTDSSASADNTEQATWPSSSVHR